MEWPTVLTTAIGSGAILSGVAYVMKVAFARAVDARVERIKETTKAEITEDMRRSAAVFDRQYDVFRTVLSLTYRARNTARYVLEHIEAGYTVNSVNVDRPPRSGELGTYSGAIIALLYDERAVIPPKLFKMAHTLKNSLGLFLATEEQLFFPLVHSELNTVDKREAVLEQLRESGAEIDALYNSIVKEVQAHLKVTDDAT